MQSTVEYNKENMSMQLTHMMFMCIFTFTLHNLHACKNIQKHHVHAFLFFSAYKLF